MKEMGMVEHSRLFFFSFFRSLREHSGCDDNDDDDHPSCPIQQHESLGCWFCQWFFFFFRSVYKACFGERSGCRERKAKKGKVGLLGRILIGELN